MHIKTSIWKWTYVYKLWFLPGSPKSHYQLRYPLITPFFPPISPLPNQTKPYYAVIKNYAYVVGCLKIPKLISPSPSKF